MKVILSAPRGFCAGVVRAIDIVEIALEKFGSPVYVRHEIVHNQYVVNSLISKGAVFVEEINEVPEGNTVIFSAHGVAPEIWDAAKNRNLKIIDATCPLVIKVHNESQKYSMEGYSIVVVGHQGHPEVIGTMGQSPDKSILVENGDDAVNLNVTDPNKVVALTQTTLSVDDTKEIINTLHSQFPNLVARNDICYATTNRQEATKLLAEKVDVVLVIGAQNSSNCNRLREVAELSGVPSFLINDASNIDPKWLKGAQSIGLTSGASTPESLVEEVINFLKPDSIENLEFTKEDVVFVLPKELRGGTEKEKWALPRQDDKAVW
ncbi:MAG: 4-hydroxy-3-methylbut-2-enyl diphosphate reductase [SAR202 cluster bacterium]|nr:4-hydroxy-3-methylbut-2-enyl diphosphate reductase [SAR202 cluster bacterium]|tara:strand:+ start:580 stop:1542 length:963 start_codon:yes stop_codon:yes gene_type:complete